MNRLNHCLKEIYILRAFLLTSLYSPVKVSHSNSVVLRTSFNLGGDPLGKKQRVCSLRLLAGFKQGAILAKSRRRTFLLIPSIFVNRALLCRVRRYRNTQECPLAFVSPPRYLSLYVRADFPQTSLL